MLKLEVGVLKKRMKDEQLRQKEGSYDSLYKPLCIFYFMPLLFNFINQLTLMKRGYFATCLPIANSKSN